ncbi:Septin [Ramicandelaber brevisporus]|nr:Septin [Ramicandelaber brevisporus]
MSTPTTSGQLGLSLINDQLIRRCTRYQHVFNLMVLGQESLGKSTFVNTLFGDSTLLPTDDDDDDDGPQFREFVYDIEESIPRKPLLPPVNVRLSITDVQRFGDSLDRQDHIDTVATNLEDRFQSYLDAERDPYQIRRDIRDERVHLVLYFVAPRSGKLSKFDRAALREVSTRANVVVLIGKSDTLTAEEKAAQKRKIMADLAASDIVTYPPIHEEWDDDDEYDEENIVDIEECDELEELKRLMPFAVAGSNDFEIINGQRRRVRRLGNNSNPVIIDIEDPSISDVSAVRRLVTICLDDLVTRTHSVHYALYRSEVMRNKEKRPISIFVGDDMFESKLETRRKELVDQMERQELEFRARFIQEVEKKDGELKNKQRELKQMEKELIEPLRTDLDAVAGELRLVEHHLALLDPSQKPLIGKPKINLIQRLLE